MSLNTLTRPDPSVLWEDLQALMALHSATEFIPSLPTPLPPLPL